MRWESWLVILFQACMMVLLGLSPKAWLIMFSIHGFVWSSQNYVNHAFSPRDIINGAHNLKMPLWLNPVYLNFNLHLAASPEPADSVDPSTSIHRERPWPDELLPELSTVVERAEADPRKESRARQRTVA